MLRRRSNSSPYSSPQIRSCFSPCSSFCSCVSANNRICASITFSYKALFQIFSSSWGGFNLVQLQRISSKMVHTKRRSFRSSLCRTRKTLESHVMEKEA